MVFFFILTVACIKNQASYVVCGDDLVLVGKGIKQELEKNSVKCNGYSINGKMRNYMSGD